jgi:ubiquinone/menaquinone biosynthesis C-methylase UbiE
VIGEQEDNSFQFMNNISEKKLDLLDFAHIMKRDWDERAHHDAKWFINTLRFQQTDEEFDRTGMVEVERLVLADLPLLTQNRDPHSLRLLEIGCGVGRMTRHLAKIFGEVVGIDVSGEMIRQARQWLTGVNNIQLYETNGIDFTAVPDESFDLVLSAFVFQHIPSVDAIASNMREAWRVLKPGGLFRFQTSSITMLDFEETEKDTWIGASFPENEIRRFARESGGQLISVFGSGTQYCWTTIRKRALPLPEKQAGGPPRIHLYGRTGDAQTKTIPIRGEQASLTMIISGRCHELFDCNSVVVEVGGEAVMPRYVGPVGRNFDEALKAEVSRSLDHFTQVEIGIPAGMPSGSEPVLVHFKDDGVSDPINVELEEVQPLLPKVGTIMNAYDNGMDVYARGEKSKLKILVEGLDEAADTGNVRVQIGERIIKPSRIFFLRGNGLYEVDAQIPDDTHPGVTELRIYFGNLQSPCATLEIK